MSISLRIALVIVSLITFIFILQKIRKAQMKISNSLYWIFMAILLLIAAVFPIIPMKLSELLGIESPANFVYLSIIFLLIIHNFSMTLKVSKLETKLERLAQRYALDHNNCKDGIDNGK